jgi:hypothetical protein
MRNPETLLTARILAALNALPGCKAIKLGQPGVEVGTPDVLCVLNGRAILLEVKVPGEHARPVQQHRLGEWRRAGAVAGVVHSVEEALTLLAKRAE